MDTKEPTKEEEAEFHGRIEQLNKELVPLCQKYEAGLGARAFIEADGRIGATPIWLNARGQNPTNTPKDQTVKGLSEA